MLLAHDAAHGPTHGLRLAVLHAWIWLDNPAGTFVTDNWALPFARLGLRAPAHIPAGAPRALTFLSGGMPYYISLADQVGSPSRDEEHRIEEILARHQSMITAWWKSRAPDAVASPTDINALDAMWNALWQDVEHSVRADVANRLRRIWQQ
jgi:hypothetical protein